MVNKGGNADGSCNVARVSVPKCSDENLMSAATVGVSIGDDPCYQDIHDIEHEYNASQKRRRVSMKDSESR